MKKLYSLLIGIGCFGLLFSQQPPVVTSADMYAGLKKLNVLGSVLYIAAHPDDENSRLLAFLSKDKLYRTGYLSLTRGDGGQNLIGNEQGITLGLIRTQELLAARRIDGAEQFFTRAFDFGFSKNPEETFTKWDREKVLSDVVWVIRNFQPDVIITRFPTTGEGGHGHHTASAILANEAFTAAAAAADPKRFPEQLKWVQPWQAKRILWNTFNFGGANTTNSDQFHFDVGGYNALLGKSYGEIAAESRSQHKSQGFGVSRSRGEAMEYFKTTGGTPPVNDLIDNIDVTWSRVKGGEKVAPLVQSAIASFDFVQPQKSVPQLVQIHKTLLAIPSGYWRNKKLEEVDGLIAACSGLWMEATASVQNAVQGDSLLINFGLDNRCGANIVLKKISVAPFDSTFALPLTANRNFLFSKSIPVAKDKPLSQPYWLGEKKSEGLYTISNQQLIGQADVTPPFIANFDLEINGESLSYARPVQFKYTDPVKGEIYQPLFVVPPVTVAESPHLVLFQRDKKENKPVTVQLNANKRISSSEASIELHSPHYSNTKKDAQFTLDKGTVKNYIFPVDNEKLNRQEREAVEGSVHYTLNNGPAEAYQNMAGINYEHIPAIRYFYTDSVQLLNMDLKTVGKRIGYITGAGDKVPEALMQMGYEVVMLNENNMAGTALQSLDAIITGVRAYNTEEWLSNSYPLLMNYVEGGGNLIVQYNTGNGTGAARSKMGPYNFSISRNRITDENAPVTFLAPAHPVFNFPNKITADDFKGWVQERSIYHATGWDKNFEPLISMHDPGEEADNGSLIVAKYGKGYFTYTGLVFFRELPAGVPGAYRLLANLIALNRKKEL